MSNTALREFVVSNGESKPRIKARSPFLAAVAAVRERRLRRLGLVLEVKDGKAIFYTSTERVLRAAKMPEAAAIFAKVRKQMFKSKKMFERDRKMRKRRQRQHPTAK